MILNQLNRSEVVAEAEFEEEIVFEFEGAWEASAGEVGSIIIDPTSATIHFK